MVEVTSIGRDNSVRVILPGGYRVVVCLGVNHFGNQEAIACSLITRCNPRLAFPNEVDRVAESPNQSRTTH